MVRRRVHSAFLLISITLVSLSVLVWGCRKPVNEEKLASRGLDLRYATHFSVSEADFGYVVSLFPNGKEDGCHLYALTRNDTCRVPEWTTRIHIPVGRVATNSGSVFEFLRLLGGLDGLVATCDAKFVYSDTIRQHIESGAILSLGSSYDINVEQLLLSKPDILLLSDLRDDPQTNVCPVVHNFEWKESSALGRAEWIKFLGLLLDKKDLADSIFAGMEQRYEALTELVDTVRYRPTVFAAGCFGDTWYMTAGQGYMADMYQAAGGDYLLREMDMPTFTCGTEWLLAHYADADFWMNCHLYDLKDIDSRLRDMKSFKQGNVYHFNKRSLPGEGYSVSDFYESAVAHPDLLLADLISIFHPEILPTHETKYIGRCVPMTEKIEKR